MLPTSAPLETETSSGAKASGTAVFKPEKASPIPVPPPTSTDAVDTLLEEDRKHARTMLDARSEVRAFMTNEE